jgi:hypothetical protein
VRKFGFLTKTVSSFLFQLWGIRGLFCTSSSVSPRTVWMAVDSAYPQAPAPKRSFNSGSWPCRPKADVRLDRRSPFWARAGARVTLIGTDVPTGGACQPLLGKPGGLLNDGDIRRINDDLNASLAQANGPDHIVCIGPRTGLRFRNVVHFVVRNVSL